MMTIRNLLRAGLLGAITTVLVACGSGDLEPSSAAVAAKSAASSAAQGGAGTASSQPVESASAQTAASPAPANDPPATHPFADSRPVPGRYIVVFKKSIGNPAAEAANVMRGRGGQIHHVYSHALKGFAATLTEAALQGIRRNPNVDYIEQDQTVSIRATTQNNATWGLDRIDQRDLPLDTVYTYNATGAGVTAFIIDTGIYAEHTQFTGRRVAGYDVIGDAFANTDCNGHGTHVAGTVGGMTWGVAKGVNLISVRVLDCSGSGYWSGVIAGINWVASSSLRPAVANMSLGGGFSTAVNQAVAGAVNSGVTMVVAAGNSRSDACRYSPAAEQSAITVGATTRDDARASYSNWGSCVDIFAPGSGITSAWKGGADASNTISGTSMASPHVAGAAALALQYNTTALPAGVAAILIDNATVSRLSSIGKDSPNLLLYSLLATDSGSGTEPGTITVAVSLDPSSRKAGKDDWRARVTVAISNAADSAAVANATVSGDFTPGGTASCLTGSDGTCTLNSDTISDDSTDFQVLRVVGTNPTLTAPSPLPGIQIPRP